MIPGMISKIVEGGIVVDAATITPRGGELFRITGSGLTINTINPPLGIEQSQVIYLIPTDASIALGTSGNILAGVTMAQNRVVMLVWVKSVGKWYIENGA